MFLKGTPAFTSIAVATTGHQHVHSLEDDLESLLYIVLYCALLWLPVNSPIKGLDWWLEVFFYVPREGLVAGPDDKMFNIITRQHTGWLSSERSRAVLDWLDDAMDLHSHCVGGPNPAGPNPAWVGGEALGKMWNEVLLKELPEDDRCVNPIPDTVMLSEFSLHATHTANTASTTLFDSRDAPFPIGMERWI